MDRSCVDCGHYRMCVVRAEMNRFKNVAAPLVRKDKLDFITDMEDRMGEACAEYMGKNNEGNITG